MQNTPLIQARKEAGYTQRSLAKELQISENGYQRYELGLREPKVGAAIAMADALHTTVEALFGHLFYNRKDITK